MRVTVCGVTEFINTYYFDIAYATNGSVHTMEDDLLEMGKLNQGKIITISGMKYKLAGTKFLEVK